VHAAGPPEQCSCPTPATDPISEGSARGEVLLEPDVSPAPELRTPSEWDRSAAQEAACDQPEATSLTEAAARHADTEPIASELSELGLAEVVLVVLPWLLVMAMASTVCIRQLWKLRQSTLPPGEQVDASPTSSEAKHAPSLPADADADTDENRRLRQPATAEALARSRLDFDEPSPDTRKDVVLAMGQWRLRHAIHRWSAFARDRSEVQRSLQIAVRHLIGRCLACFWYTWVSFASSHVRVTRCTASATRARCTHRLQFALGRWKMRVHESRIGLRMLRHAVVRSTAACTYAQSPCPARPLYQSQALNCAACGVLCSELDDGSTDGRRLANVGSAKGV
jgi:hypothetical protein